MSITHATQLFESHMKEVVSKIATFQTQMVEIARYKAHLDEFNCNMQNLLSSMELVGSCNAFADVEALAEQRRLEQQEIAERLEQARQQQAQQRDADNSDNSAKGRGGRPKSRSKLDGSMVVSLRTVQVPPKFRGASARGMLEMVLEQIRVSGEEGLDAVTVSKNNALTTIQANEYLNCLLGIGLVIRRAVPVKKGLRSTKSTTFRFTFNKENKRAG